MEISLFLQGVITLKLYLPDAGLIDIALAKRRQQADIKIQTGPVGQRFGDSRLLRLSCQVCRKRHYRRRYVDCPRIAAAGQQLQEAQTDERNHHSQQPL